MAALQTTVQHNINNEAAGKCWVGLYQRSIETPHNDLPNQVAQSVPLGELLDVKKALSRPIAGAN